MTSIIKKISFSLVYAIMFGIVSSLAAIVIVGKTAGEGWEIFWLYSGSAGFITAYTLSKYFIENKKDYSTGRIIIIALIVAFLSHWLCWYEAMFVNFIKWKYFGMHILGDPFNPLTGIYGALTMSFISILFFGWTAFPISIGLATLAKRIKRATTKPNLH